jgi:hypothetical protein
MPRGHSDRHAVPRHLPADRLEPGSCGCRDTIAITIDVAGHVATLHLCQWCGDSWHIDGIPASREAVHELMPRSEALSAIWRRAACSAGIAGSEALARG